MLTRPRIRPDRCCSASGEPTSTQTGIVDRLEQAGFVRRQRDPKDRRQVNLELNLDKVRQEVFPIFEQLAKRMGALAASYRKRDLATILDFMERGIAISREHRANVQRSTPHPAQR